MSDDPYNEVAAVNVRTTDGAARELEKFRRIGIQNTINSNNVNRLKDHNMRLQNEVVEVRAEIRKIVEQREHAEIYLRIYESIIASFVETLRCGNIAESLEMAQMLMSKLRDPQNSGWVDGSIYKDVVNGNPQDFAGPELHPIGTGTIVPTLGDKVKDVPQKFQERPSMTNEEIQKLVDEQEIRDKKKK